MGADPQAIEEAVLARDPGRVRELLKGAGEADRRACAHQLREFLAEPEPGSGLFMSRLRLTQTFGHVAAVAGLAGGRARAQRALAGLPSECWSYADARGLEFHAGYDAIAGILADRDPPWLADVTDSLLRLAARERGWLDAWQLARRLVRLGAIQAPDVPEYASQMVSSIFNSRAGEPLPLAALLDDPGLLDDEVWRLFTEPSVARQHALDEHWADALSTLAVRGLIDRDRLLDECLGAFGRGFSPKHVGWYVTLHDRMAPAPDELAARGALYLALLAAPGKPGVLLGERVCAELMRSGRLAAEAFLAASEPALLYPQKSVATAHLAMVAEIAAARPGIRDLALVTVARAFGHEREDVQAAALKLIAKHGLPGDAGARAAVTELAGMLSPALGPEAVSAGVAAGVAPPAVAPPAVAPPAVAPAVAPPAVGCVGEAEDGEEVVAHIARLLEDATDAIAVERAVAGMVRLASLPVRERAGLAAPLLKRALKRTAWDPRASFKGWSLSADVAWLTLTWATGKLPDPQPPQGLEDWGWGEPAVIERGAPESGIGILYARLWEACELISAGQPGPLLAEPEFTDGSIGHDTLLERVARQRPGAAVPRYDLEMALLRLAPGAGEAFWEQWDALRLRRLPAAGAVPAAARARRMYEEGRQALAFEPVIIPANTRWGPDPLLVARLAGPRGAARRGAGGESRSWRLLTDMGAGDDEYAAVSGGAGSEEDVSALPLLCPHQPELIAANLMWRLSDGLRQRSQGSAAAIGCLAELGTGGLGTGGLGTGGPAGFTGHLALVTALSSSKADKRIAAAQAWTRWAADGRLDAGHAVEAIRVGVAGSVLGLNRIGEALSHAVMEGDAAFVTARCCLAATAALLDLRPTGLHLLLEVAARAAAVSAAPELPAPVAALAAGKATSKLAEAARRVSRLAN